MNFPKLGILLGAFLLGMTAGGIAQQSGAADPAAYRSELRDLHILRDYRVLKNSFVLGLETRSERPTMLKAGERRTILSAEGMGSLRHIWETHRGNPAPFVLEFFVDGEIRPSLHGNLGDLIAAAQKCEQRLVLNPGGIVPKDSHNLYLPVPFDRSLRIDLVATAAIDLVFLQLDCRLDDTSLRGVRLIQEEQGSGQRLVYHGIARTLDFSTLRTRSFGFDNTIGQAVVLRGPGILRRLAIPDFPADARLTIRFDHAKSPAVDVLAADFFGPFTGAALDRNQCFLPMPFRNSAEITISSTESNAFCRVQGDLEPTFRFPKNGGWFHAKSSEPQVTTGFDPAQILLTRGRGQWLGMSLYKTGHDHGGGDFAVIDGDTSQPGFLHGINGEDYFSFAWFGRGENHPYSQAFDNDTGRFRLHLENPYTYKNSLQIGWGTLKGQKPRAVSYWYENSPADNTLSVTRARGLAWEVFGPVEAPVRGDGFSPDTSSAAALFAPLPAEQLLDSGRPLPIVHLYRGRHPASLTGWARQTAVGSHLNLTYVYGHASELGKDHHMGYYARLMMARTILHSPKKQAVFLRVSYDDPLELSLNGEALVADLARREGFTTKSYPAQLRAGQNRLLVKIADTPNINTCWAGFSLHVLDDKDRDITNSLRPNDP